MKIIIWILLGLLVLYLVFGVIPTLLATLYSYRGVEGRDIDRNPKDLSKTQYRDYIPLMTEGIRWYRDALLKMQTVHVRSYDGLQLSGHYLDAGHHKTAILVHGYHTTIPNNFGMIGQDLLDFGFNLLFIDQRAFGESGGKVCTFGLKEQYDLLSWIDFADRELRAEEILLYGVSMGGASVAYCSDKIVNPKVKALVDDCGFTCVYDLQVLTAKKRHLPGWLMMPLVILFTKCFFGIDIRCSTENALKNSKRPVFFIHGAKDDAVPVSWGQRNYEACGSVKEQMIVKDAGHAVAYIASGDEGKERLRAFIQKYYHTEE